MLPDAGVLRAPNRATRTCRICVILQQSRHSMCRDMLHAAQSGLDCIVVLRRRTICETFASVAISGKQTSRRIQPWWESRNNFGCDRAHQQPFFSGRRYCISTLKSIIVCRGFLEIVKSPNVRVQGDWLRVSPQVRKYIKASTPGRWQIITHQPLSTAWRWQR